MRRIAALLLVVGLALGTGNMEAQQATARPTPVEVAGAMLPCIDRMVGAPFTVSGTVGIAEVTSAGKPTMYLYRQIGSVDDRDALKTFWLDADPIHPPMNVIFMGTWQDDVYPLSDHEKSHVGRCMSEVARR